MTGDKQDGAIAVIGMAVRAPGSRSAEELWRRLREGADCISSFTLDELAASGVDPELAASSRYVPARGVLAEADCFDAGLFGMTDREALVTDPQHRVFLECALEALESSGHAPASGGMKVGVYAGSFMTEHFHRVSSNPELVRAVGPLQARIFNDKDFLATLVSYKLGLTGPSMSVQTACSTSLVAVHVACQSLLAGECDIALAGGVAITLPQEVGYLYREGGVESRDGRCRAFDADASGMVSGNGVGVVVLKRLAEARVDGDPIRAVIRGSAVNNDGADKMAFTAPSIEGQAEVIAEAVAVAGVDARTIGYVEAHGTGTPLGDPIEVAALTRGFDIAGPSRTGRCALGSVKTNVGHLDAAAGVVGLIKTVLALEHREIPPSLHFETPNPEIDFEAGGFYVNTALRDWPGPVPRRAGVHSVGVGGTNAHVVVEEAPPPAASGSSRPVSLLLVSAASVAGVERAAARLEAHCERHPELDLADVAYTLQVGRAHLAHRRMCVVRDRSEIGGWVGAPEVLERARLGGGAEPPDVAFLFPGQGAQYLGMGRELYDLEPRFRREVDECSAYLAPLLGTDLQRILFAGGPVSDDGEAARQLTDTAIAQPALFTVEYALARLWTSWGVRPRALIGHSVGELVAACVADVMTRDSALELVAARGRLMQEQAAGAMLAVGLGEEETRSLLAEDLSLAAVNGPAFCVVSGPTPAIERLADLLARREVPQRPLRTSHAFHSPMMDPMLDLFRREVEDVELRPPAIPCIAGPRGDWITPEEATSPDYWVRHARETVRFADGMARLLELPDLLLLEVGPGQTLTTMVARDLGGTVGRTPIASMRHPRDARSDLAVLIGAVGQLWLSGLEPDWSSFYSDEPRRRVPLPTYPFERWRFRVGDREALEPAPSTRPPTPADAPSESVSGKAGGGVEDAVARVWKEVFGHDRIGRHDNFFDLGGNSLLAIQIAARLRDELETQIEIHRILEAPTIARLASSIGSSSPSADDLEVLERLLSEVEALGDDRSREEASDE